MTNSVHVVGQRVPDASRDRTGLATLEIHHAAERDQTGDRLLAAELELQKELVRLLLGLNEAVASNLPLQEMIRAIVASVRAGVRCDAVAVSAA